MCDMIRSRLIAWVDGELLDGEAQAVSTHVAECEQCRHEVRRIEALSSDIGEYCAAVSRPQGRRVWWWIPVAAAALVVLAVGLVSMRARRPAPVIISLVTPAPVPHERMADAGPASRPIPRARARRITRRPITTQPSGGEPGLLVVIPIDELLPVGAAPPGAVLVGNLTFDAGGPPGRLRLQ